MREYMVAVCKLNTQENDIVRVNARNTIEAILKAVEDDVDRPLEAGQYDSTDELIHHLWDEFDLLASIPVQLTV